MTRAPANQHPLTVPTQRTHRVGPVEKVTRVELHRGLVSAHTDGDLGERRREPCYIVKHLARRPVVENPGVIVPAEGGYGSLVDVSADLLVLSAKVEIRVGWVGHRADRTGRNQRRVDW